MLAVASVAAMAACSSGGSTNAVLPSSQGIQAPQHIGAGNVMRSCSTLLRGDTMRCFALMRTDVSGRVGIIHNSTPAGYGPADLQSAYKLPSSTNGSGQTIAIVDAYNDPNAASDLSVYRSQYGLPACTTSSGCFKKVSQTGSPTRLPRSNGGWAQEESLDIDMASAICPKCHIILVEASTASNANLAAAVNEAIKLGANVVSNSYGGGETGASNAAYNHPGHVITASAGDSGYGPQQPCSYSTVVCIGGTTLNKANNSRGWSETAWSGSGSGCSAYVSKPSWQTDHGCTMRSESDTSADADPNTGVAVYDSYAYQGYYGWMVFGGTSVASPVLAGVYALAGNAGSVNYAQSIWAAGGGSGLNDVTSGSNGTCPSQYPYICNAGPGYDGPTGWGTPSGVSAY